MLKPSKKAKRGFINILWSILENVPIVLTVILGAYAALISQFGSVSQTSLLGWTLIIVTLLATSELLLRFRRIYRIEELSTQTTKKVDVLASQTQQRLLALQERISADKTLVTRSEITEFQERIKSANDILLSGQTLSSITRPKYISMIENKLKQGASVRIILLNPDIDALDAIAKQFEPKTTLQDLLFEIEHSLSVLSKLYQNCQHDKLEVRVLDTYMQFSIIATDPEEDHGRIHIEFYTYQCPIVERPHMELQKMIDERWFKVFYEEFLRRWNDSSQFIPFTSHRFAISEPEPVLGRPVVFLDRDGVINQSAANGGYISSVEEFKFEPTSIEAIKALFAHNFYVIVVTNQAGVGRGIVSLETVDKIHLKLLEETRVGNKYIQVVYVCPHTRDMGCVCRKPRTGLLRRACVELEIDPKHSYLVGDSESDIVAGTHMGCTTIQINNMTSSLAKVTSKHTVANLGEAVTKILELEGRKKPGKTKGSRRN